MSGRFAAACLALFVVSGCAPESVPSTQSEIEERLTCQCGCGLTVESCNHLQCGFAVPVRKAIADSLAAGQTGDEILKRYVEEYGEKVLSSPTRQGFNLVAWYGPYLAILLSAVVIILVMRRWRHSIPAAGGASDMPDAPGMSAEQRHRLERELERLEQ